MMRRKWLLTTTLIIIGTTALFGCGKTTTSTTEVTTSQEVTTQAPETTTQAPEATTQAPETTTQAPETTTQAPETATTEPFESTTTEVLRPKVDKETKGSGTFTGQIDSNSIEIELDDGSYETFFIYNEDIAEQFNNMDIGTKISFTYGPIKGQVNPEILSVTVK